MSNLSYQSNEDSEKKSKWMEKTKESEMELNKANEQIIVLNEERESLKEQLNALKQEMSSLLTQIKLIQGRYLY